MRSSYVFVTIPATVIALLVAADPARATPDLNVSKKAGQPKSWHAGIPVTAYSVANVRNGNCWTPGVGLFSWSGRGPAIDMTFFHNSHSTVSGLTVPCASGVYLGKGWTHSYGGQLYEYSSTVMRLIGDDGCLWDFTRNATTEEWDHPKGFYATLTEVGSDWKLLYKDQSYRLFNTDLRLIKEVDASGNEVVVTYETSGQDTRIDTITDAAGREISFAYDSNGRLESITAPWDSEDDRTWTLSYESNGWLERIDDPEDTVSSDPDDYYLTFEYSTAGRIKKIFDANGNYPQIVYDSEGYVGTVKDAPPYNTTQIQSFAYDDETQTPTFSRTYTDRRGEEWVFTFDTDDNNLIEFEDPLGHVDSWTYDEDQYALTYTNNLSKTWEYEWDSNANLLSITNPLGQKTEWTYNSLNQVTSVTPALNNSGDVNTNKTVEYFYNDSLNPTMVTEIQEPSTPSGGDPISTYLSYYGHTGNYPEWKGLLAEVNDPNGVITIFGYDDYGQLAEENEGFGSPGPGGDGYYSEH